MNWKMAGSSAASSTVDRLKQLETVEGDVISAIQSAGKYR